VEAIDSLYNYSLNEAARHDAARDQARGVFTTPDNLESRRTPDPDNLPRILWRIREYRLEFSERALNVALGVQAHEDGDCKFLGVMLAFSDFYANKRQKMRGEQTLASAVERT